MGEAAWGEAAEADRLLVGKVFCQARPGRPSSAGGACPNPSMMAVCAGAASCAGGGLWLDRSGPDEGFSSVSARSASGEGVARDAGASLAGSSSSTAGTTGICSGACGKDEAASTTTADGSGDSLGGSSEADAPVGVDATWPTRPARTALPISRGDSPMNRLTEGRLACWAGGKAADAGGCGIDAAAGVVCPVSCPASPACATASSAGGATGGKGGVCSDASATGLMGKGAAGVEGFCSVCCGGRAFFCVSIIQPTPTEARMRHPNTSTSQPARGPREPAVWAGSSGGLSGVF